MPVVMAAFSHSRGFSGAPASCPSASSPARRIPQGRTAKNTIHQMRTKRTTPDVQVMTQRQGVEYSQIARRAIWPRQHSFLSSPRRRRPMVPPPRPLRERRQVEIWVPAYVGTTILVSARAPPLRLLDLDQGAAEILGMQEQHRLVMGADLGLAIAEDAGAVGLSLSRAARMSSTS